MPADRRGLSPNVVTGIGIMLLGVALMLERLGMVDARTLLRFWPLLLVLLGASLVVQALWGTREDGRDGQQSGASGLWIVLVIVALFFWQAQRRSEIGTGETGAETVSLVAVMGSDHRTSVASRFRGADMTTLMGQTRLDLRQAVIDPGGEAVIDVFTLMGGATVHVPRDWTVDVQAVPIMGRVRDARARPPAGEEEEEEGSDEDERTLRQRRREARQDRTGVLQGAETLEPLEPREGGRPSPRVVLRGFVMMGALTIRS